MRRVFSVALLLLMLLPLAGRSAAAAGASRPTAACKGRTLRAVASRTHGKVNACIATLHRFILETTYYQNASRLGGTALAAYPEARIRYGLAPRIEAFIDYPSEIAKSGDRGTGVYFMTGAGVGAKVGLGEFHHAYFSISGEEHPPLAALANTAIVPDSLYNLYANWSPARTWLLGASLGSYSYTQSNLGYAHVVTPTGAFSVSHDLNARYGLTAELSTQSVAAYGGSAQTTGTIGIQRVINPRLLFSLEIGTAFNASAGSKPHYLGFGFTFR
ncbi:MAG: hypothetical protein ACP5O6_02255 [Candidatus Baltobacteraceae bacterium]